MSGKAKNMIGKKINQDSGVRLKIHIIMNDLKRNILSKSYVDDDIIVDNMRYAIAGKVYKSFDYWKSVEDI